MRETKGFALSEVLVAILVLSLLVGTYSFFYMGSIHRISSTREGFTLLQEAQSLMERALLKDPTVVNETQVSVFPTIVLLDFGSSHGMVTLEGFHYQLEREEPISYQVSAFVATARQ